MGGTPAHLICPGMPGIVGMGGRWTPKNLFAPGAAWVWFDPSDLSTLFSDRSATPATPATVDGSVGTIKDKSPNGWHAIAPSDGARGILRQSGSLYYIETDGIDDCYVVSASANGIFRNASLGLVAGAIRGSTASKNWFTSLTETGTNRAIGGYSVSGTGPEVGGRRLDANSFQGIARGSADTGNYASRGMFDWANSDLYLYHNGALSQTKTDFQTDGNTSDTDSTSVRFGSGSAAAFWSGRLYQIIAGRPLSLTTGMTQLDNFLKRKAGI